MMDLSKPFDSVYLDILVAKLHAYGYSEETLVLFYSYLKRRKQNVEITVPAGEFDETSGGESSPSPARYGAARVMHAPTPEDRSAKIVKKFRLRSLDTFRGLSIIIMIFVNYTGGRYWFFSHSTWNGLTVADLVFPWFIFIMGSSIFISCRSLKRKRVSKRIISKKIVIRSIKLFLLGLFLNNGYDLSHWRIPGVLQRFSLSYLVVGLVNLWFSPDEDMIDTHYNYNWRDSLRDIAWFPIQNLIMGLLLLVYLLILFLVPYGDCPKGYFGPGGRSEHGYHWNCTGGITRYIDHKVFTLNHMYNDPTCKDVYQCIAHDPEGLLGVIPSILLTYLGLQAARILFLYSRPASHIKRWLIWAFVWGVIAIGLSGGSENDGIIPINKNLWSLSFILATGSLAYLLLTLCYVIIDVKHYWSGVPFYFGGMNAILLYAGHELLRGYFPFMFKTNQQHWQLLLGAFIGTSVWTIIAAICYKNDFFVKI